MKNEKAFTLLEILIVMFIFSLIGAVIGGSYIAGNRINASQEGVIEIQQNIRVAFQMMSREIRMAGFETEPHWNAVATKTLNQIQAATTGDNADRIQFRYLADTNNDGAPDSTAVATYFLDGNNDLNRTYDDGVNTATTVVIASNITAMWITYLSSDGTWKDAPDNPPVPAPASWEGVNVTRAVGLTIVGQSTKVNRNINSAVTFTDPRIAEKTITVDNQLDHRMASSIIELKNINSEI